MQMLWFYKESMLEDYYTKELYKVNTYQSWKLINSIENWYFKPKFSQEKN